MIDAHVHSEKGDYSIGWIEQQKNRPPRSDAESDPL